jgi:quinol monooxygenase YgiN
MSYVVVEDVAASWERYQRLAAPLRATPAGLILHAAGRTDEGFRIVEVWESEDAWRRFSDTVHDDSKHVVRTLVPEHVVYGEREEK